jgi:hypothetical protein
MPSFAAAIGMQQAIESGRRDDERGIRRAAENGATQVAAGGVHECLRHEAQPRKCLAVTGDRRLVFGAALDIFEHEAGHAAAGDVAQIGDVERAGDIATGEWPAFPGHGPRASAGRGYSCSATWMRAATKVLAALSYCP